VGKVGVPSELLNRPAILTEIELDIIKEHSRIGYDVLQEIEFPWPVGRRDYEHSALSPNDLQYAFASSNP
jgi:HD-GYP domain-containing protein (c-di-GMP phosphodiesterase class II)